MIKVDSTAGEVEGGLVEEQVGLGLGGHCKDSDFTLSEMGATGKF